MLSLVAAACFFVGIHIFVSGTTLRDRIVERVGEAGFQGLFSLASLVGLIWLIRSYSNATPVYLWGELPGMRWIGLVGVFVAFIFAVVGITTPSPTGAGGEGKLDDDEPATGMLRITRHPFLWGVAVWALCHLLLNGEASALVFFGALLVLALAGPPSIDAKRARKYGEKWERFAAVTSNVPFAAIAAGRNELRWGELATWRAAVAIGLFAGVLVTHVWLFGVSPFPL